MKNFLVVLCLSALAVSCSKSTPAGCSQTFNERFADDINKVNNAASVYAMDPTPANCAKFKEAYIDYIDALDDWEACAVFYNQRAEWQQSLDAAREAAEDIVC